MTGDLIGARATMLGSTCNKVRLAGRIKWQKKKFRSPWFQGASLQLRQISNIR